MSSIVKTNVKREENSRRKRRRRRHQSFYIFLVFVMVIGIGILLSLTLLFNISDIKINGEVDYANEDIIRMSGISKGDNLVRLNSQEAADGILSTMIYIESVSIDKQYPDTVVIDVTKCIPTVNVEYGEEYLVVSAKGKILDKSKTRSDDLILIQGFDAASETLGTFLTSNDPAKDDIIYEFLGNFRKDNKHKITSVNMEDKYEINVNYENRIIFEMGNANDTSYKLSLAQTVLDDINNGKEGYMTMVGTNQISFREKESASQIESGGRIPLREEDMPVTEPTTTPTESIQDDDSGYDDDYYYDSEDEFYEEDNYQEENYEDSYEEYYGDQEDYYNENSAEDYYE